MGNGARMVARAVLPLLFLAWMGICETAFTESRCNGEEPRAATDDAAQVELSREQLSGLAKAFESGFHSSMRESDRRTMLLYQQSQQRLADIDGIRHEMFEAGWKIDLDIDGQPAREVLSGLFSDLGLWLPEESEFSNALEQPVRLQLRGGSRLQAVEAICGQIGIYPDYWDVSRTPVGLAGGMMHMLQAAVAPGKVPAEPKPDLTAMPEVPLRRGERPFPLVFAGPYAVGIDRLDEFPPHALARLNVSVFGGGVPASVAAYWEHEHWYGILDFRVRDACGVDLVVHDTMLVPWSSSTRGPKGLRRGMVSCHLMNLQRSVRSIHVDGRVSATIPVVVETVRLDDIADGSVKEGQKMRVRVAQIRSYDKTFWGIPVVPPDEFYVLDLAVMCDWSIPLAVMVRDGAGKALRTLHWGLGGPMCRLPGPGATDPPTERCFTFELDGEPKSLTVKAFVVLESIEYPVALSAHLRSSAQQPVEPVELKFSGPAPVTVDVLKISGDSPYLDAEVEVTNGSNKDIRFVSCIFEYFDPAGQVMKHPRAQVLLPRFAHPDGMPFLVLAKSTIRKDTLAAFAPQDAASATATLDCVYFADGTTWRPPDE